MLRKKPFYYYLVNVGSSLPCQCLCIPDTHHVDNMCIPNIICPSSYYLIDVRSSLLCLYVSCYDTLTYTILSVTHHLIVLSQVVKYPSDSVAIVVVMSLLGFVGFTLYPVCFELGVECTYPVPESVSSGIIVITGSVRSLVKSILCTHPPLTLTPKPTTYFNTYTHHLL